MLDEYVKARDDAKMVKMRRNRNSALSETSDVSVPKLILPTMPPGKMRILFTSIFKKKLAGGVADLLQLQKRS